MTRLYQRLRSYSGPIEGQEQADSGDVPAHARVVRKTSVPLGWPKNRLGANHL